MKSLTTGLAQRMKKLRDIGVGAGLDDKELGRLLSEWRLEDYNDGKIAAEQSRQMRAIIANADVCSAFDNTCQCKISLCNEL